MHYLGDYANATNFGGPKGIWTPVDGVTSRYTNQTVLWDQKSLLSAIVPICQQIS